MSLPSWCQSALLGLTVGAAIVWLVAGFLYDAGSRTLRGLDSVFPLPDGEIPSLTIVAAARNEAPRVAESARSFLSQDIPILQVVAVDDRSTDPTGEILQEMAARDPRLSVIRVSELPNGWLGKCHALARGAAAARGEWILFTDGDIALAPEAARRALSYAIRSGADHLAVAADLEIHGLGEAIFIAYFVSIFNLSQRPWDAPNPKSDAHIGIGAFNLVRKEAYERAGGHGLLRMELLDDMGLGLILKRSGSKSLFAHHDGLVRARWQEGLRGLIRGVEKNAFSALGYRPIYTLLAVALQSALSLLPALGLFSADPWTKAAAVMAWSGVFLVYSVTARGTGIRVWHALLMPVGAVLFGYAILASMTAALVRGGVVWRGTFYPLAMLKAGRVR